MVRFRICQRHPLTFYEICRAMSVPRVIMGVMYANVDSLCCRLSSHANKSGRFLTEQAANTERIKAGAGVGSRGHQFAGDARRRSSKLIRRLRRQFSIEPSCHRGGRWRGKKKHGLISADTPARPDSHQGEHGRLWTAKKNGPRKRPRGVAVDVDGAAGRKSPINKEQARHQEKRSREIWVVSRGNG